MKKVKCSTNRIDKVAIPVELPLFVAKDLEILTKSASDTEIIGLVLNPPCNSYTLLVEPNAPVIVRNVKYSCNALVNSVREFFVTAPGVV